MGVPKFFRYISERYPCLSEVVREYQIPEFDNLYLDMNGIIHMCSHPDDADPHFRITQEKIFQDIFHYIEVLFRMIKPRKLFFMAVDGVAPRAKMNQQRGRRFRSAKEAVTLEAKARERGEILPPEARFDSNCITPGTVFMAQLHEQLKYFVVNKISTDKLWRNCKIVLSGHETPGEGEHKIMDYIRYMRSQPGYDPNTRHCLYGLDADLIMLGLCTHEPHFSLLREEVRFGKKSNKRKNIPEQITFFLLHLSLMREYLELEFLNLKDSLQFEYDMEKIIDDWVLMGFLVGNDFIPHLPNMHIANGALPILYKAYMKVLPTLGGYINEAGTLNLERFEAFIKELSSIDIENFTEKYADLKWFEGKTGRRFNEKSKPDMRLRKLEEWVPDEELGIPEEPLEGGQKPMNSELAALIKAADDMLLEPSSQRSPEDGEELEEVCEGEVDSDTSENDDDLFNAEFIQHKTDYYMNKLEYADVTPEVLRSQAEEYVRAIQWNLHYYYNGVCSWSWYYPHHYAPYVSDIKGFGNLSLTFELGDPFRPYEQLLAVLPAASKCLLPIPYQELMTEESSPIKEYYPEDFKTDLNGKKQEWEAVVLIPFIEEEILLKAMETCNSRLTPEEKQRNSHGPMLVYQYSSNDMGIYAAPEYFPAVNPSRAACQLVFIEDIRVPRDKLIKGAYPGVKFDVYYPGFPTMKHLKYTGCLERAKVKVFEQPSRGDNMILTIVEPEEELPTADAIAKELLGKTVHVGWPHLVEAMVVSISNREYRYHSAGDKGQYNVEENKGNLTSLWNAEKGGISEHYKNRLGVDVGVIEVLAHVKVMVGRKYVFSPHGRITLEKQWADVSSAFPIQVVVRDIAVYEENYASYKDVSNVFPMGSHCFMLGQPCYGAMGEVLDSKESLKNGRLKLCMKKYDEPDLTPVIQLDNDIRVRFMNLYVASTKLAISRSLFSRITGCVFITTGRAQHMASDDTPRINIGLNLKFNKRNEEVPGYTRKDGNTWLYSEKAIALVRLYMQTWPKVFEYLNFHVGNDIFFEEDMFPDGNAKECLREITTWMKQQPFYSIERQVCGSSLLDPEATQMLEQIIDEYNLNTVKVKQVVMQVKPHLLYKPDLQMGNLMPDPAATFRLYDRIINVREGYTVPLGFKGTIIGIHKPSTAKESDTLYDVVFDQPFVGGLAINCSPNRGYRMPRPAIINISHGIRVLQQKSGKPGQLQNVQNQGGARNNYKNNAPTAQQNTSGYPPGSQFQPQNPMFANWSHGCNFPMRPSAPPVPNFNQYNYNYNPNFNGPFAHPAYVNPPTYNNPGPNTFVPYKTNHFPLSTPLIPQQFVPQNSSGSQLVPNGNAAAGRAPPRNGDEKREKNAPVVKAAAFKQVPTQVIESSMKKVHAEAASSQFSKIDSDMLKKMLKIDENHRESNASSNHQTKEIPKKENSGSLSVEDLFAHVRSKEQHKSPSKNDEGKEDRSQSSYYTARLLTEFQTHDLGIPSYQYFKMSGNKIMASVTMPNGEIVCGEPGSSKVEASENVATKALAALKGTNSSEQIKMKPPLEAVPEPPKQWRGMAQSQNSHSPQKSWSKGKSKSATQENWRSEGRPDRHDRVSVNQSQIHKHLNFEPTGRTRTTTEESNGSKSDPHKKYNTMTITNSSFVPLQAVRQHRSRTSSTSTKETSASSNDAPKQQHLKQEREAAPVAQATANTSSKTSSKPRRERKMRIAANFQTAMSPK